MVVGETPTMAQKTEKKHKWMLSYVMAGEIPTMGTMSGLRGRCFTDHLLL